MPYSNAIPQPNDLIRDSQTAILNNFAAIQTLVGINHINFNDPLLVPGKHNFVSMPSQVASPATLAGEVALFSRISPLNGVVSLCLRDESNGVVVEFTNGAATQQGWTRLPSGILLKWGNAITLVGGFTTVIFPVGATIPAFTQILQMLVSTSYISAGADGDGFVRLNNYIAPWTDFTVWGSPRTTVGGKAVAFSYLAIGL